MKKKKDLGAVGWALLGGSSALALYLLLRPKPPAPVAMTPTIDPRYQQMPVTVASLVGSFHG